MNLHRRRIQRWIRKYETILVGIISIGSSLIVIGVTLYLYFIGSITVRDLLPPVLGLPVILLGGYIYFLKRREQTALISLTSQYLLEKDPIKIDELLGVLISDSAERISLDPVETFFTAIIGLCTSSPVEMRRRIAEALPALLNIDILFGEKVVRILREDWDDEWKADIRRRTIEGLSPILHEDRRFVEENLELLDGDEIFTIMAIVEVLFESGRSRHKQTIGHRLSTLLDEMSARGYSSEEQESIKTLWSLLECCRKDRFRAVHMFEEHKDSTNLYEQICVARNLRRLCPSYQSCGRDNRCRGTPNIVLKFMEAFLEPSRHPNVRRPMARQESLDCLITMLKSPLRSERAKEIIRRLMVDTDRIIPTTAFDKIERILALDKAFGHELVICAASKGRGEELITRATRLAKREGLF